MDTLRRRYHTIGNKINTLVAYLSVVQEGLDDPKELLSGTERVKDLKHKCQIMEKTLFELEAAVAGIKGLHYRSTDPDRDIALLLEQAVAKNKTVRVLVVDDEEDLCALLRETVGKMGVQVETALGVEEARELVRAHVPQIALLDLYMGEGLGGLELLEFFRTQHPQVKCLVITWEYSEDVLKSVREFKPEEILIKPVMPSQLRAKINGLIAALEG